MKAKTLKKGLGIALSMAMTMSLFGCGSGDSAKEQASDTSETTEVAENTDSKDSDTDKGGKDMTFWIFLDPKSTEDPRSVVLSNIVKEYNETNQYGNTVTVVSTTVYLNPRQSRQRQQEKARISLTVSLIS